MPILTETVSAAMQGSAEELQEIPEAERAVVRPWLQAFTATWVPGHISYNGTQIREQIQAVYDAGYEEWTCGMQRTAILRMDYLPQEKRSNSGRSWLYNKSGQEHRPGARSDRSIR